MKFFKSAFITLLLLIVCTITAMAAEESGKTVQYVDQDGSIKTAQNVIQIIADKEKEAETPTSLTVGNWYWLGQTPNGNASTIEITKGLSITEPNTPGTINIITGPNGGYGVPAMNVVGNLTIPNNVTVNVYGAPSSSGDNQVLQDQNCFVQFNGSKTTEPGITVSQGGILNVLSGAICGRGYNETGTKSSYPTGIQVEGKVTIEDLGELQGTTYGTDSTSYGITVNTTSPAGSFQANGGTVYSFNNDKGYSPISGVSNLIVDGGTISTLTPYSDVPATSLKNGVWWSNDTSNVTTLVAFGKSTFFLNGYKLSGFTSGDTFTVQNGAELTLGDFDLSFGSQSTLDIDQGGTLIIPSTTDVTMQSGSVLTNDGIIDVQESSTEMPANS